MQIVKISLAPMLALLMLPTWAQTVAADNCEALRERIETNIASKGLTGFSVTVVDANAPAPGDQVGSCGNGTRKIMYLKSGGMQPPADATVAPIKAAAPAAVAEKPRPAPKKPILTECKDGSVSMGGDCKP